MIYNRRRISSAQTKIKNKIRTPIVIKPFFILLIHNLIQFVSNKSKDC